MKRAPAAAPSRGRAPRRAGCRRWVSAISSSALRWPTRRRCRTRRRARTAGPSGRRSRRRRRAPSSRVAATPRLRRALRRGSACRRGRDRLGQARLEQRDQLADAGFRAGRARGCRETWLRTARAAACEQLEPHRFGDLGVLDRRPQLVDAEQPLGGEEGDRRPGRASAFLLGQARTATIVPSRLTMRLATLVAMISRRRRCCADARRRGACASAAGRRRAIARPAVGSSASLQLLDRRLQRHLGGRQQHRQLGPGQAAILVGAAQQLLVAVQPLDRAVEPAAVLEQSRSPGRSSGSAVGAAALGDRQRQRLQAVVLEHELADTSSVMLASSALRCLERSRPSRISRLSGILMLTSLSEQSTPAELSMKSVLMRPPRCANSIRAGLGDGQVGAFADAPWRAARRHRRGARRWPGRRPPRGSGVDALM